MLFHAVLFNFRNDLPDGRREEILELARKLADIPGVQNLLAGKTIKSDSRFEYAIAMNFDGEKELQEYRDHPDHVKFRDEDFFPFVEDKEGLDYVD